nr:hypothetical protein [Tanacetum cinerariifolium]
MSSFNQRECLGCGQPCDGLYCYLCTYQQCGVSLTNGICLDCTYRDGKPLICCECEGLLRGGFCWFCDSRAETSFAYDLNPNSFDDSQNLFDYPPQPQCETYLYELCGNDSHYGYDCPPRFPLVYEQEPSYNQNYNDNYYPHNSPSFLCCDNCEGPRKSFQCQPMNQNYFEPNPCYDSNYSGFDYPRHTLVRYVEMIITTVLIESTIPLNEINSQIPPSIVITNSPPVLPIEDPEDSLIMRNEDLNTIPEKESDEFIKSSVEDLVLIPSEYEDSSGSESVCILPSCDDFSPIDVPEEKASLLFPMLIRMSVSTREAMMMKSMFWIMRTIIMTRKGDILYLKSLLNDGLVYHDPSIHAMSVASILEGYTDEPPLEENDDLFDLEPKNDDWKKILYDAPIDDLMIDDKVFDPEIHDQIFSPTYVSLPFTDFHYIFFTYVVRILLLYFTYLVVSPFLLSSGSEDTIFDPDIFAFHFSHRSGTFISLNVYPNILNESPIEICSSTRFTLNITMIWGVSS